MARVNALTSRQDLSKGGTSSHLQYRIEWVDALRALAMVFVIYGHQVPEFIGYFVFTSPIKITLFFAITGYVFKDNVDKKLFFYKLLRQLVIPWIVLSLGPYIILTPIKGIPYLYDHVVNILIGKENWYMPACIIAEVLWYFILKTGKKWIFGTMATISFIVGIILYQHGILSIFMINRALCALIFIFMGYLFRQYENGAKDHKMTVDILICTVAYVALGITTLHLFPGQNLDVHLNRYYNYPICFAMILAGLFVIAMLAKRISHFPKWIISVGQNTLVIYLFHSFVVTIVARMLKMVHLPINVFTNVLITAITCVVCTVLAIIISRFVPELMGKKRIKKK